MKVLIVEDNLINRDYIKLLLAQFDLNILEATNGIEGIEMFEKHPNIDCILMDIHMPRMNGIECTEYIKREFPETLIMMCTVNEDDEKIFSALKAGASGYILKRAAIEEIFTALEDLVNGGSPMSNVIARKVVGSFRQQSSRNKNEFHLSAKENEILDLLAEGYRIKEIADKLQISINTVRTHIRHIYEKLQVQSRVEALNKTRRTFL